MRFVCIGVRHSPARRTHRPRGPPRRHGVHRLHPRGRGEQQAGPVQRRRDALPELDLAASVHDRAPTVGELERNREAFWDTQPSYGGSAEIWDVLKAAVASASSGDIETARLFVESAGCIVATPHLTVVFDERGAKYDIRGGSATPANVAPDVSNAGDVA